MNDLNTIRRLNATAFHEGIGNLQRKGRFVVATYEGLSLYTIESFSDESLAQTLLEAPAEVGQTRRLFYPFPVASTNAGQRDQSEDRALTKLAEAQDAKRV